MNKDGEAYTRCVRGAVLPNGPFVAEGAVVNDQATGLMWEKHVSDADMNWPGALAYCYGQTTGGYTDWRLPDMRELGSVVDFSTDTPALDAAFTTGNPSLWLWSSSPSGIDNYTDARAFGLSQEFGYTDTLGGAAMHVLCVRGGQVTPITPAVPFPLLLLASVKRITGSLFARLAVGRQAGHAPRLRLSRCERRPDGGATDGPVRPYGSRSWSRPDFHQVFLRDHC